MRYEEAYVIIHTINGEEHLLEYGDDDERAKSAFQHMSKYMSPAEKIRLERRSTVVLGEAVRA